MTYYLLFLICGFFAGVMFEKNRIVKKLMRDSEALRHELLKEVCKRLSGTLLLSRYKSTLQGILAQLRTLCAMLSLLLIVGCAIPMGSPMGYYTPSIVWTPSPVSFYMPPVAMDFTTGQWQAPDAFTEFKPRTPIPRQASGMIGNQYFTTLY